MKIKPEHKNAHISRMEHQRDLRRVGLQSVNRLLVGRPDATEGGLFKSDVGDLKFESLDHLVLAGNQSFDNLDTIDFAGFRNDKELAQKILLETREHVRSLLPEAAGKEFNESVSRVLNARYLQGHGIQVQSHLDGRELSALRQYFQEHASAANVADAARAINSALAGGEQDAAALLKSAEMGLFAERGVEAATWQAKFAGLDLDTLRKTRDFSDYYASSESGKYLTSASGESFDAQRDSMARQMLADRGFSGSEKLSLKTVQTLLWDTDNEGPRSIATYREAVNAAVASGKKDYVELNIKGNEALLTELGVSSKLMGKLKVSKTELAEAYPDTEPKEARAERTKVLRDLLRVLPDGERAAAIVALETHDTDLIKAESTLSRHLADRMRWHSNGQVKSKGIGAMQRANTVSALSKLPEEVKKAVFRGKIEGVVRRMEAAVESAFAIEVHRKVGTAPVADQSYGPYTKDWTVQGLADLYNGLAAMSKDGKLPPGLSGTTTVSLLQGSPDSLSMTPVALRSVEADPNDPFDRPGAYSHKAGASGFYGEASADENGHDNVVLCDDALMDNNSVGIVGQTLGERTVIHEFAHAIQLGGTPDVGSEETRRAETQKNMAEWSSLSLWTEADGKIADSREGEHEYYYDPGVKVQNRAEVATSYGATDPCEDFAEFVPFFFKDAETAMSLSAEKFLYTNEMMGGFYSASQTEEIARQSSLGSKTRRPAPVSLTAAEASMRAKVAGAPERAGLTAPLAANPEA